MKHSHRLLLSLVLLTSIFLFAGCTPELAEEESQEQGELQNNDELNDDCDEVREELAATQAEYEELQSTYSELSADYDELSANYDGLSADYDGLSADYDELSADYNGLSADYDELSADYNGLSADYNELSVKYDTATQGTAGLTEEEVEQAIFERINTERRENELDELVWSSGIYQWAKVYSQDMAEKKSVEVSDEAYWQDVFRAAGYSTLDRMTDATFIIWKDRLQYETNFLNEGAEYGAVGVTKLGEIFYITYYASTYK